MGEDLKNTGDVDRASKQGLQNWALFEQPENAENQLLPIRILSKIRALGLGFMTATREERNAWAMYYVNRIRNLRHRKRSDLFEKHLVSENQAIITLTGADQSQVNIWDDEFTEARTTINSLIDRPSIADKVLQRLIYIMCRASKPDQVIETGVWHGVSSFFLLSALAKNNRGELSSVDLEPLDARVRIDVGGAVPQSLHENWHLHMGPTKTVLPKVMSRVGEVDLFIHDSSHWYHDMVQDFAAVWPHMKSGAPLIADDIEFNDSLFDFANEMGISPPIVISRDHHCGYIGIIIKP
ncbi:class I SAM-dependent methyltransferase [Gammaproteobacteria bacterium]|nr:class I SAM-dependent methyltransferase [Gammaproteobacteria bacterium]